MALYAVLLPNFDLFDLSALLDPIKMAQAESNADLYRVTLVGLDRAVCSSAGIEIRVDGQMGLIEPGSTVAILGGRCSEEEATALRQQLCSLRLESLVVVSDAVRIFDGQGRAQMHSSSKSSSESNPEVCAGLEASIIWSLKYICSTRGATIAADVADRLNCDEAHIFRRTPAVRKDAIPPLNHHIRRAVEAIATSPARSDILTAILLDLGIGRRQLERLFRRHLNISPGYLVKRTRLRLARDMLCRTDLSVQRIARTAGFASLSHFAREYKARYGVAPAARRFCLVSGIEDALGRDVHEASSLMELGDSREQSADVSSDRTSFARRKETHVIAAPAKEGEIPPPP